jgi:hypothetical protein
MTDPIQIESPQANINRARYAGKDFFTFVDDLVARIQVLFVTEFNDFVTSGTGQMLIDIVAWAAETLSFYIDRQATESYISTARTRKGVVRLARQLGYKVSGAVAAAVDLTVTLGAVQATPTTVPLGFQWKGPNDLVFETVENVTFLAGDGPASVPRKVGIRQGTTRVEIFTSTGDRSQVFRLSPGKGNTIAGDSVACRVAGADWVENEIITFDATDQFETGLGDDPPTIRFGNGVAGNVPVVGAEIRVQYFSTTGSGGLVQSGTITQPVSPLVVGATIVPLIATNADPTTGGADQESLDRVKSNAPRVFRAHTVAITRDDYESLSQAYTDPLAGSVAVAQAFVARSADDDLQLQVLLNSIRTIVSGIVVSVEAETAGIAADVTGLSTQRTAIDTAATSGASDVSNIGTAIDGAKTGTQSLKSKADQVKVDATDVQTDVTNGNAEVIDGKALVDASSATVPEKTLIKDSFDLIKGFFDLIGAEASNISGGADGIKTDADAVISQLNVARTNVDSATTQLAAITAAELAMVPLLADVSARVVVIDGLMDIDFGVGIETDLQGIFDHVDAFLAADCQSNLIEVPILTRDVDGFLTAPPVALVRSLQSFLEARMEVTQTPEVVSGELFLVKAIITCRIGVLPGFVSATVLSNVSKAIDDVLRVRAFGASLRISDLDRAVAGIAGVKYAVFKITDPADHIDVDGNLIIATKEVVTKKTVTLTSEAAAA